MTNDTVRNPMSRLFIVGFCVSATIALIGMDQRIFWMRVIFKTLTTLLLFAALGRPDTPFRRKVALGIFFSLVGDVALLSDSALLFKLGTVAFLLAHFSYIAAFLSVAQRSLYPLVIGGFAVAMSLVTVVLSLPGAAGQGMTIPVVIYATALTAMVVAASATIGGPLLRAPLATVGAFLFYIADSSLAITTFMPDLRIPHPVLLTTGVYWVGQLSIATTARAGARDK
jgi:uncharacterized membrane protein YhhN